MKQAEINKLLNEVLGKLAKAHQWKCSRGFLFKSTPLLFFSIIITGQAKQRHLSYRLTYKWFAFDDLFWKIVKLEENAKRPLSFHVCGAWTVPMTTISEGDVPVADWGPANLQFKANEIVAECALEAERISQEIQGLDDNMHVVERYYMRLMEKYPAAVKTIWLERLFTSVLKRDHGEAARIVRDRLDHGDAGGFQVGAKSFYALADEFLQGA